MNTGIKERIHNRMVHNRSTGVSNLYFEVSGVVQYPILRRYLDYLLGQ